MSVTVPSSGSVTKNLAVASQFVVLEDALCFPVRYLHTVGTGRVEQGARYTYVTGGLRHLSTGTYS
eukprot:COSAG05_NODE_8594_length_690_cov_0.785110_1_plen_66_part_00